MMFYLLVIMGVFASSCSQLLLKNSAKVNGGKGKRALLNWSVIIAYCIFFSSLVINISAMRYGVNMKDLPILESSGYIFVPILSFLFLNEKISWRIIISMMLIVGGILVFYL